MEIADVVMKLVGRIDPIGETHVDGDRLYNLKVLVIVVDELLDRIYRVAEDKDCAEYSRKEAGKYAYDFLRRVIEENNPDRASYI